MLKGTKTVRYWHKNRCIEQWKIMDHQEINPCIHIGACFQHVLDKESLFNKHYLENLNMHIQRIANRLFSHYICKNQLKRPMIMQLSKL
jgi:hypothetical protein